MSHPSISSYFTYRALSLDSLLRSQDQATSSSSYFGSKVDKIASSFFEQLFSWFNPQEINIDSALSKLDSLRGRVVLLDSGEFAKERLSLFEIDPLTCLRTFRLMDSTGRFVAVHEEKGMSKIFDKKVKGHLSKEPILGIDPKMFLDRFDQGKLDRLVEHLSKTGELFQRDERYILHFKDCSPKPFSSRKDLDFYLGWYYLFMDTPSEKNDSIQKFKAAFLSYLALSAPMIGRFAHSFASVVPTKDLERVKTYSLSNKISMAASSALLMATQNPLSLLLVLGSSVDALSDETFDESEKDAKKETSTAMVVWKEASQILGAAATGAVHGLEDWVEVFKDPMGTIVYPMYHLASDTVVLVAVPKDSKLYQAASQNMDSRYEMLQLFYREFLTKDATKNTEEVSRIIVNIVPGFFLGPAVFQTGRALTAGATKVKKLTNSMNIPYVQTAKKVQLRTEALLQGGLGATFVPLSSALRRVYRQSGASGGTFITDIAEIEKALGPLPKEATRMMITSEKAAKLEQRLGLPKGAAQDGGVLSIISDVAARNPRLPSTGNQLFLGFGKGLPKGGPELVISPIRNTGGGGIRQIDLTLPKSTPEKIAQAERFLSDLRGSVRPKSVSALPKSLVDAVSPPRQQVKEVEIESMGQAEKELKGSISQAIEEGKAASDYAGGKGNIYTLGKKLIAAIQQTSETNNPYLFDDELHEFAGLIENTLKRMDKDLRKNSAFNGASFEEEIQTLNQAAETNQMMRDLLSYYLNFLKEVDCFRPLSKEHEKEVASRIEALDAFYSLIKELGLYMHYQKEFDHLLKELKEAPANAESQDHVSIAKKIKSASNAIYDHYKANEQFLSEFSRKHQLSPFSEVIEKIERNVGQTITALEDEWQMTIAKELNALGDLLGSDDIDFGHYVYTPLHHTNAYIALLEKTASSLDAIRSVRSGVSSSSFAEILETMKQVREEERKNLQQMPSWIKERIKLKREELSSGHMEGIPNRHARDSLRFMESWHDIPGIGSRFREHKMHSPCAFNEFGDLFAELKGAFRNVEKFFNSPFETGDNTQNAQNFRPRIGISFPRISNKVHWSSSEKSLGAQVNEALKSIESDR